MTLAGASMTGRKSNRGEYIRNSLAQAAHTMDVLLCKQMAAGAELAEGWALGRYCLLHTP